VKRKDRLFSPRQHWHQTQVHLILGGLTLVLVVGGGLVWLFYGRAAAITAASCLLGGGAVIGFLWLLLTLLERWVRDEEP
jgi:hypothetical protein